MCGITRTVDLIHDTRHLCTRSKIDGIKAMSRGISGGKQVIKFANTTNRGRVYLLVNLRNRTGEERRRQTLCDKRDNNFI